MFLELGSSCGLGVIFIYGFLVPSLTSGSLTVSQILLLYSFIPSVAIELSSKTLYAVGVPGSLHFGAQTRKRYIVRFR